MESVRLKDINLADYIGNCVPVTCLVKSRELKADSRGGQYLKVTLMDGVKELNAVFFGDVASVIDFIVQGNPLTFMLEISDYKGNPSAKISNVFSAEGYTIKDFIPWIPNYDTYRNLLSKMITSITNPVYKTIITGLFDKYMKKYEEVPAATGMHHTQFGGVLAHSVSVALAADALANNYEQIYGPGFIDRELLRTAALIHDIAKCDEINCNSNTGEVEYSNWSALHSHIVGGILEVQKLADKHDLNEKKEVGLLIHCISAHHGVLEYGSPVTPAIPEAEILNTADNLDAAMWRYHNAYNELESTESSVQFKGGRTYKFYKA